MMEGYLIAILVFEIASFALHVIEYFDKEGEENE